MSLRGGLLFSGFPAKTKSIAQNGHYTGYMQPLFGNYEGQTGEGEAGTGDDQLIA